MKNTIKNLESTSSRHPAPPQSQPQRRQLPPGLGSRNLERLAAPPLLHRVPQPPRRVPGELGLRGSAQRYQRRDAGLRLSRSSGGGEDRRGRGKRSPRRGAKRGSGGRDKLLLLVGHDLDPTLFAPVLALTGISRGCGCSCGGGEEAGLGAGSGSRDDCAPAPPVGGQRRLPGVLRRRRRRAPPPPVERVPRRRLLGSTVRLARLVLREVVAGEEVPLAEVVVLEDARLELLHLLLRASLFFSSVLTCSSSLRGGSRRVDRG